MFSIIVCYHLKDERHSNLSTVIYIYISLYIFLNSPAIMGFWDKIGAQRLICSLLWKKTNPDLYRTDTIQLHSLLLIEWRYIVFKYIIIYIKILGYVIICILHNV